MGIKYIELKDDDVFMEDGMLCVVNAGNIYLHKYTFTTNKSLNNIVNREIRERMYKRFLYISELYDKGLVSKVFLERSYFGNREAFQDIICVIYRKEKNVYISAININETVVGLFDKFEFKYDLFPMKSLKRLFVIRH